MGEHLHLTHVVIWTSLQDSIRRKSMRNTNINLDLTFGELTCSSGILDEESEDRALNKYKM